jgi:signal transduction histidine kinase
MLDPTVMGGEDRSRNVRAVVATTVSVTLLVAGALTWLGWRLLSQERVLEQQRSRDRLEQVADGLVAGLLRVLTEAESRLAQVGSAPPWRLPEPVPGAVAVLLRPEGIETRPTQALVYLPVLPQVAIDELPFQQTDRLEFHDHDLAQTEVVLVRLANVASSRVSTEARLRQARVQAKSGRVAEALHTYRGLRNNGAVSSADVPYAVLARFESCRLLGDPGRRKERDQEAMELLAGLESGQWPMLKDAYAYYSAETRRLLQRAPEQTGASAKLAIAETVESLWASWESNRRNQFQPPGRRVYGSGRSCGLVLSNSTPERVAALVFPIEGIDHLVSAAGWKLLLSDNVSASLVDEQGEPVLGMVAANSSSVATRSLAAANIPWTIRVATRAGGASNSFLADRRSYLIFGLTGIAGLVAIACYAMARGVLREMNAAQLQADFVSAVSHEFRSPLTTLMQLTELLAHGRIHDDGRRRQYFDVLQKETGRLHRLVENLLDYGRMQSGRAQYRPKPIDLYELVRDAVREYQEEISGSGYALELKGATGAPLRADPEALRRLVRNLLENAVKYSPGCQTVWIEAGRENGDAVLRVRDRGMGIAPSEQVHVFEKFVRGSAAKQACIQGTGIGLAMVKEIVKGHRGEVQLESEVGQGSTFTVRLPIGATAAGGVDDQNPGSRG